MRRMRRRREKFFFGGLSFQTVHDEIGFHFRDVLSVFVGRRCAEHSINAEQIVRTQRELGAVNHARHARRMRATARVAQHEGTV